MDYIMAKVSELVNHPRNTEFFDDMTGEKWSEFVASIKENGVIEPIVKTPENLVVCGNQRVRACRELGIEEIPARIKEYTDDDAILKDLLESNIRRRGENGGSSIKLSRIINELERLNGIKNGGDHRPVAPLELLKTQEDLAQDMSMSLPAYKRVKRLVDLIPELQDMIDDTIPASAASRVIAMLSSDQQRELLAQLPPDIRLTQKEIEAQVAILKQKDQTLAQEQRERADLERKLEKEVLRAHALEEKLTESHMDVAADEIAKREELQVKFRESHELTMKQRKELAESKKLIADLTAQLEQIQVAPPATVEVEKVPEDYVAIKAENERLIGEKLKDISKRIIDLTLFLQQSRIDGVFDLTISQEFIAPIRVQISALDAELETVMGLVKTNGLKEVI